MGHLERHHGEEQRAAQEGGFHTQVATNKFSGAISRHEKSIQISTKAIIATGKLAPKRSIKMPKISAKRLILA